MEKPVSEVTPKTDKPKGINVKTDLQWGDTWYIKSDEYQYGYALVGLVLLPGKQLRFRLSYCGEIFEVFDFECSQERDEEKASRFGDDEE
jgi:hypothetical protein